MKKMNILLVLTMVILIFAGCTEKKAGSFETAQVEEEIKETKDFTEDNPAETVEVETSEATTADESEKKTESVTEPTTIEWLKGDYSEAALERVLFWYWSPDGTMLDVEKMILDRGFEHSYYQEIDEDSRILGFSINNPKIYLIIDTYKDYSTVDLTVFNPDSEIYYDYVPSISFNVAKKIFEEGPVGVRQNMKPIEDLSFYEPNIKIFEDKEEDFYMYTSKAAVSLALRIIELINDPLELEKLKNGDGSSLVNIAYNHSVYVLNIQKSILDENNSFVPIIPANPVSFYKYGVVCSGAQ